MPRELNEIPDLPELQCLNCAGQATCWCGRSEQALRGWQQQLEVMSPMSEAQRQWCYKELDSIEGHSSSDYQQASDSLLAGGVLSAWQDYCRDKGLL